MSHEPAPAEAAPKRGPGLMTVIKGLACVSVIVLLEAGAAMALLPSAEETKKMGAQLARAGHDSEAGDHGAEGEMAEGEHADAHGAAHEVSLGAYHVVSFNPATGTSTAIDFELFGVVLAADEQEFAERYLVHEKRLNEQVTIAIRSMQPSDFSDPGLGLIKRVILEKVNRALGKTLVREAIFSQFAFMER